MKFCQKWMPRLGFSQILASPELRPSGLLPKSGHTLKLFSEWSLAEMESITD